MVVNLYTDLERHDVRIRCICSYNKSIRRLVDLLTMMKLQNH